MDIKLRESEGASGSSRVPALALDILPASPQTLQLPTLVWICFGKIRHDSNS
jgi:hypothetical protein